jgi:hypothetical protein
MAVISALRKWRQEDHKSIASLDYIGSFMKPELRAQ